MDIAPAPRMLTDAMFGKLGKFLRLLGFDVIIADVGWPDQIVFEHSLAEGRLLITRDAPFFEWAHKELAETNQNIRNILYLPTYDLLEQIAGVFRHLGIDPTRYLWNDGEAIPFETRCPICNGLIKQIGKDQILDKIPAGTAAKYTNFWQCQNSQCTKIYWIGRHFSDIRAKLEQVIEILNPSSN